MSDLRQVEPQHRAKPTQTGTAVTASEGMANTLEQLLGDTSMSSNSYDICRSLERGEPEPLPSRFFIGLLWAVAIEICAVTLYWGLSSL